jgi:hypothetical protein
MTKIIDANCENEAPKVSTVIFPGQSHISSGIIVLNHRQLAICELCPSRLRTLLGA